MELVVEANSEESVFAEAAVALGELIAAGEGEPATRTVSVSARDRGALLVDWLEELIFLADTESFTARSANVVRAGDAVRGEIEGVVGPVDPLVKAATYHGLSFEEVGECWRAHVVLDV